MNTGFCRARLGAGFWFFFLVFFLALVARPTAPGPPGHLQIPGGGGQVRRRQGKRSEWQILTAQLLMGGDPVLSDVAWILQNDFITPVTFQETLLEPPLTLQLMVCPFPLSRERNKDGHVRTPLCFDLCFWAFGPTNGGGGDRYTAVYMCICEFNSILAAPFVFFMVLDWCWSRPIISVTWATTSASPGQR